MRAGTMVVGLVAVVALAGCGAGASGPSVQPGATGVIATGNASANPTVDPVTSASAGTETPAAGALPYPCALITQEGKVVKIAKAVPAKGRSTRGLFFKETYSCDFRPGRRLCPCTRPLRSTNNADVLKLARP